MEMDKEEGEMSDDPMLGDEDNDCIPEEDVKPTLLYKAEKQGIIITQLEKIDAKKLEERAKRFGLNLSGNRVVTQKQIDELYSNFGIESGNERHFRFDALHLNGVDGLNTKDIFEYLADYKPVSLEWIDHNSCNIVCQDHISAALALLVHSREIKNEDLKDMLHSSSHHWREGVPHPKKDLILMRFATNGDKKMPKKVPVPERKEVQGYYDEILDPPTKNPWGDLCKSWGVYDNQEVIQRRTKNDYEDEIEEPVPRVQIRNKRLAMRLGKRHHKDDQEDDEDSDSDSAWKKKSKAPRMRMHADDEESKQNKKRQAMELTKAIADKDVYAPLSIEVVNSRSNYTPRDSTLLSEKLKYHNKTTVNTVRNNVQSRLGAKFAREDVPSSSDEDSYSSDESDHNTMSRVQKMSSAKSSSVWSRLESKATNSSDHNDLRQILKSKKQSKTDDLRDRISKYKKASLRIEIDNK